VLLTSDRKVTLTYGIQKLNEQLPAAVYLPFVSDSVRSHCVLRICESDWKVFQTKTRAPVMLCIEMFRPEELLLSGTNHFARMGLSPQKAAKRVKKIIKSADQ